MEAFQRCRRTGRCPPGRGKGAGAAAGFCPGAAGLAGNPVAVPSIGPLPSAESRATEIVRWMTLPTAAPGPAGAYGSALVAASSARPDSVRDPGSPSTPKPSSVPASVPASSAPALSVPAKIAAVGANAVAAARRPSGPSSGPAVFAGDCPGSAAVRCATAGVWARGPVAATGSAVSRCQVSGVGRGPEAGTIRRTTGPAEVGIARVFSSAAGLVVRWTPSGVRRSG